MKPLRPIVDGHGHTSFDRALIERGISPAAYRTSEPSDARCLFCETTDGERTKEHIVSEKLTEYLGIRNEPLSMQYENGVEPLHVRDATHGTFVSSNVCGKCNNGWMSGIDARFLSQVKEGWDLDSPAVAEWLVKTSMTANAGYNMRLMVPRPTRLAFADPATRWHPSISVFMFKTSEQQETPFDYASSLGAVPYSTVPGIVSVDESCAKWYCERLESIFVCGWRVRDMVGVVVFNEHGSDIAVIPSVHRRGKLVVNRGTYRPHRFSELPTISGVREAMAFQVVLKTGCTYFTAVYPTADGDTRISPRPGTHRVYEMTEEEIARRRTPPNIG